MNYYKKYLKYKKKYLYIKGGKPIEPNTRIEPITRTVLPLYPQQLRLRIFNERGINDFFEEMSRLERHRDGNFLGEIQSPLLQIILHNRINLVNLRTYLQNHLLPNEYINIAWWPNGATTTWARKTGDNLELYAAEQEQYYDPPNSRLALFLRNYTPSTFFTTVPEPIVPARIVTANG